MLATGGFQANRELLRRHVTLHAEELLLRAGPGSTGDGLRIGLEMGADTTIGMDQFYGRNMPAPPARVGGDFVRLGQLYARHAEVTSVEGERYEARSWSEVDVVQWTARQPGARAWFRVGDEDLGVRVRGRTVGDMVEAAAGGSSRAPGAWRRGCRDRGRGHCDLGGLKVDEARAHLGVFACGGDVGDISPAAGPAGWGPRWSWAGGGRVGAEGVMEHAFASEFTVGVEEELFLVDSPELGLRGGAPAAGDRESGLGGRPRAFACEVELRSPPVATPGEALAELAAARTSTALAGATTMGAGLHPSAELFDVQLVHQERYAQVRTRCAA